ncbi:MAG: hypothetical protein WC840_01225 [Candidatus Peribacteraceae bacterium]
MKEPSFIRQSESLESIDTETEEGIRRLGYAVKYPPDMPPDGASDEIIRAFKELKKKRAALKGNDDVSGLLTQKNISVERKDLIISIFQEYADKLKDYENKCISAMYPLFLKKLGINSADPPAFDLFLKSLDEPTPPVPPASDKRFTDEQRRILSEQRKNLEETRTGGRGNAGLFFAIQSELSNLWAKKGARNEKDWQDFANEITKYQTVRKMYDEAIRTAELPPSWIGIVGTVSTQAAALSFAESKVRFGKPLVLKGSEIKLLQGLDEGVKQRILAADLKIHEALKARGIQRIPNIADVLATMEKNNPHGGNLFRDMLKIGSPLTVIFYAYMLHEGDNKIKTTLEFAAYMAACGGSEVMLQTTELVLTYGAAMAKGTKAARTLEVLAKIPGNSVVKFAAAIGLVMLGAEKIDEFTTWLDETVLKKTMGTAVHDAAGVGISVASGDAILSAAIYGLEEKGFKFVDPEHDAFRYLSAEFPTIERRTLDTRMTRTEYDWNDLVERNMQNPAYNPLRRRLWELEKIDPHWFQREAARLYQQVAGLRNSDKELGAELKKHSVISDPRMLNLSEIVTADDGYENVSRSLKMALENPGHSAGRARRYFEGLPDTDPNKQAWRQYVAEARTVARSVTLYRHLKMVTFSRDRWVGKGDEMPPMAEQGFIEELVHTMRRGEVLRQVAREGSMSRKDYAKNLASMLEPNSEKTKILGFSFENSRPGFFKRALTNAAEAAAAYLPESTDANILFQDIQHQAVKGGEIPESEMLRLRDELTDSIRTEADKRNRHSPSDESFRKTAGFTDPAQVLTSFEIRIKLENYAQLPDTELLGQIFKNAFGQEIERDQNEGGKIFLCQCIVPESGLAVLTLTSIHPAGPDQNEWRVKTHRYNLPRWERMGFLNPHEINPNRGPSDESSLLNWMSDHPKAAEMIKAKLDELAQKEQKTFAEKETEIHEAVTLAESQENAFIRIPHVNQYRRKFGEASAILTRLPNIRTFSGSMNKSYGPDPVEDFSVLIRKSGQADLSLTIGGVSKLNEQTPEMQKTITEMLTTPVEGHDRESIAGILNMFETKKIPSILNYFGTQSEFGYRALLKELLPEFEKAKNKKYFLKRLLTELIRFGKIDKESTEFLTQWFKSNPDLFNADAADLKRFEAGERILGSPEPDGFYVLKDGKKERGLSLYYSPEYHEWLWSLDRENWESVKQRHTTIGPRKYQSPSTENIQVIEKLAKEAA